MAAPWDRRAQRAEIPKLAIQPAIPPFPGQAATVGVGTSGKLTGSAKPDHTHPAQDIPASSFGVVTEFIGEQAGGVAAASPIPFTAITDPDSGWNAGTHHWIVPRDGIYTVSVDVALTSSVTSQETLTVFAGAYSGGEIRPAVSGSNLTLSWSKTLPLVAGDAIYALLFPSAGHNFLGSGLATNLVITYLGA